MVENLVVVRARAGKPLVRAILETVEGGAVVCMPEHASAIRQGLSPASILITSKKDLFQYYLKIASRIRAGDRVNWSQLSLL